MWFGYVFVVTGVWNWTDWERASIIIGKDEYAVTEKDSGKAKGQGGAEECQWKGRQWTLDLSIGPLPQL